MRDPIERFLAARVSEGRMPGSAWWVEGARGVVSQGVMGLATRLPRAEPLTEGTPFDLASLTKPLATALLLVLLEQDRLVELKAPLGSLLPEFAGSSWASTPLLALATHTSGLPSWRPLYLGSRSLQGYLTTIAGLPRAAEPGRTLYSDLGYVALGAVLERAAGMPLDALFRRRIAAPLELLRTGFATTATAFPDAAATEQGNDYERRMAGQLGATHAWRTALLRGEVHDANAHGLGGVAGHAGLFGPLGEVARLAAELLRPARLGLGARARARLLDVAPASEGRTVGLVTARYSSAAAGVLPDASPGHTGFTGTSIWLDPAGGRLYVLLTHRVHPRVPERSFQPLRRGFHRLAAQATD